MKKRFMTIAAASLLSVGAVDQVLAQDSQETKDPVVKCYGIAKAGSNDCSDYAAKHGCAGQSVVDYNPCEWKAVTRSECKKGIKDKNQHIVGRETPQNCLKVSADAGEVEMAAVHDVGVYNIATIPPAMGAEATTEAIITELNSNDASVQPQNSQASSDLSLSPDSSLEGNNNNVVIIKKKKAKKPIVNAAPVVTNNSLVVQTQTSASEVQNQNSVVNSGVTASGGNNTNSNMGMQQQKSSVTATVPNATNTNNQNAAVKPQQNSASANGPSVTITGSSESGMSSEGMSSDSFLGVSSSNTMQMPQQSFQEDSPTG